MDRHTEETEEVLKRHCVRNEDGTDLEYLTFPLLEKTEAVRHLFSTRIGGVSEGEYASMNFSIARGDREEAVLENYKRIAGILGCDINDMVASHQTHTTNIRRVTGADRGKGISRERDYENVDGLMTDEPGIVLVTYYADCVPLYFVDPVHRAIGLAHSGWRGTADRMGECMVRAMQDAFGSRPEELYAAIGPSICRDCYEVSEDVALRFADMGEAVVLPGKAPGKYQLDLWLANERILEQAGIPGKQIAVTDLCTCHNSEFLFSHRASGGKRGNLGAFLMLKP
ncbi:MAG: peptidoglycan editing factor PgeF [Lachnospiraceae bacterium]|nr:peptidoglycan editing factor PgeF [Lachnospiraceae bacterium]